MNKRKMTTLATAGLAGILVPVALGGTAVGQQQVITTCPPGQTAPQYCTTTTVTTPPQGTTTGTTTPPVTTTTPSSNPPVTQTEPSTSAPKRKTTLTVKRKPARDKKAPFAYTLSGTVKGASGNTGCQGKLTVTVKRGKARVQSRTVNVARNCKFSVKLKYTAKKLKVRKGKLSVALAYQGNNALLASKRSTSVRFG